MSCQYCYDDFDCCSQRYYGGKGRRGEGGRDEEWGRGGVRKRKWEKEKRCKELRLLIETRRKKGRDEERGGGDKEEEGRDAVEEGDVKMEGEQGDDVEEVD